MENMVSGRDVKAEREKLINFIAEKLKVYPTIGEGLSPMTDINPGGLGLELLEKQELAKCWTFTVAQRGVKFIVGRNSSIRNTHGYDVLSFHKLEEDPASNIEDNPNITIELLLRELEDERLIKPH